RADRHRSFLMSFSRIPRPMGANKIKEFWQFFLSQTKSVWVFILGNTWGNKMSKSHSVDAATGGHRLVASVGLTDGMLRFSRPRGRSRTSNRFSHIHGIPGLIARSNPLITRTL